MKGRALAILSVIVASGLGAGTASADDYGRWSGLGRPQWQPPAYARAERYEPMRFGERDPRWRGDWDRREPRGHHYGWSRHHHHPRHHHRPWWD